MRKDLDCRGLTCPQPVIETRNAIAAADVDAITVQVDNVAASENVRRFLGNNGFSATVQSQPNNIWLISATRNNANAQADPTLACTITEPLPAHEAGNKTLVFISTTTLGRGDDTLGEKLMGNFLATLPEMGSRLWRIVLVNGGVKLAAQDGKALEALQTLANAGVSILVCGTCLEFYGLTAAKRIGETTNMLDIVTSLDLADKIIRP